MVRDWLGIVGKVGKPLKQHPKREITGFDCTRSEVSGTRVWGWAQARFGQPENFFARFLILNYCPLVFLEEGGRNRTPDKLPKAERQALHDACDASLRASIELIAPQKVIGIGVYARDAAKRALAGMAVDIQTMLHPSPASPKANRGWAKLAERDLAAAGIVLG
jgi:single-strand selective monofunctional uracil DNA glycosylase